MADFAFNISLGFAVNYGSNVFNSSPTNSQFVVAVLATAGIESDAVLKDKDEMAALVSGTTNYVTNSGYVVKTIADTNVTISLDDTSDRYEIDIPDQVWTAVGAGDGWQKAVIAYDADSTTGTTTDSAVVPISAHDFVLTPDGSDITLQVGADGFYWAT